VLPQHPQPFFFRLKSGASIAKSQLERFHSLCVNAHSRLEVEHCAPSTPSASLSRLKSATPIAKSQLKSQLEQFRFTLSCASLRTNNLCRCPAWVFSSKETSASLRQTPGEASFIQAWQNTLKAFCSMKPITGGRYTLTTSSSVRSIAGIVLPQTQSGALWGSPNILCHLHHGWPCSIDLPPLTVGTEQSFSTVRTSANDLCRCLGLLLKGLASQRTRSSKDSQPVSS
jgi:hypothetical protein